TLGGLNFAYPDKNYEGMWALDNPGLLGDDATDENGKSLICISQSEYSVKGQLLLPKFSTKDSEHARVNLMIFCYSGMATSDVYAVNNSGEQVLLGTINYEGCTASGWKNFIFDLPAEWNGKPWTYVICDVTMANPYQYFVLDKYEAYDCPPTDYRVRNLKFNLSEGMSLGSEIGFEATVENIGYTTSAFPALKGSVMDGNDVISEIDIELPETNTLGDSESAQVSGTFSIRKADYVGRELTLLLEVTDADGNIANNTVSRTFTVDMPDAPVVTDLTATEADSFGKHVFLNWSDPYEGGLTETFESIAHGWYGTFIGEWKNIDYDGRVPFALGNYDVPDGSRPKAFQVLDIKELGIEGLDLPSGSRLLCA
ncbi:MAG: hypothetical protein K2F79_04525, partial [Muribaculaceae bacterium]|nr:hypothetical protein [Muribaculaceae bacterium]